MQALSARRKPTPALFTSPRFWIVAILVLGWTLRLFHLGSMSIWWDESLSADRAGQDLAGILSGGIRIQDTLTQDLHPPLYFFLLHFSQLAFGPSEFALRILSAFANLLTIALFFPGAILIARSLRLHRREGVALLAALFAALSPFYVWYSQEARPYALVLFWSLLAVYALFKMLGGGSDLHARTLPYAALYLFALAATLTTHYLSFLLLPFHAAVLLIYGWRERRWQALAALLLAGFALLLVVLTRSAAQVTGGDVGSAVVVPLPIIMRDVLNSVAAGVTVKFTDVAWLDLVLLALWCIGIASTLRPPRRDYRLALALLGFLFLPAFALEVGSLLRPLYLNSRHLITTSPAFYLGLALGVGALTDRGMSARGAPRRALLAGAAVLGVALFAAGAAYSLDNLYFNPAYAKDDHRGWAQYLRERAQPGDLVILNAPQAETVYRYYAPANLQWISLPHLGLSGQEQEKRDFEDVVNAFRKHSRIWYLEIHRPVADPVNHIYNLLARFGTWLNLARFSGTSTEIVLHEIAADNPVLEQPPTISHPLLIPFGAKRLVLHGYDAPREVAAGAHAAVKLYWELEQPTGEEYGVSLRLKDDGGRLWAQWDDLPTGELLPISQWPLNKLVAETHLLPVQPGTPPGKYHLEAAVYHAATHEPIPPQGFSADDGVTPARLGDLLVTRPAAPLDPRELAFDHRTARNFDGGLMLVGYDLDSEPRSAGDAVPLTLYFQMQQKAGSEAAGRVLLRPPIWAWNRASASAGFTLPLVGRIPGDIIQATVAVAVPADAPAGVYGLTLVPQDGARPWDDWLGFNALGTVTVR